MESEPAQVVIETVDVWNRAVYKPKIDTDGDGHVVIILYPVRKRDGYVSHYSVPSAET